MKLHSMCFLKVFLTITDNCIVLCVTDMKTGVISQAKGSAYIEQSNTKVICSVFDPREIPRKSDYSVNGELYCEFKFAPFSCIKWRSHQPDAFEKECSLILRRSLEPAVCRVSFVSFKTWNAIHITWLQSSGIGCILNLNVNACNS